MATAKLQQTSIVAVDSESETSTSSDDPENASSEEESDYESGSNSSEPPTKRARHSVASPLERAASTEGEKESLSLLPTMPLDVLFEVLSQLAPEDLLNVSRTNKLFRATLLASNAKTVWKRTLQSVGAPEWPSDFTEPRWARLLFGTSCESCGAKNIQDVDFFLRRRVCAACKRQNQVLESELVAAFPDCDDLVLNLIPSKNIGGCKFFWKSDIEEMIHSMASYKQKKHMLVPDAQNEFATFIAQRTVLVDEIHSNATKFSTWLKNVVINRQTIIRAKFIELGYEEADLVLLYIEKEYNQTTALNDNIWKQIRPLLESNVKRRKDERLAIKLRDIMKFRRNLLDQLYTNYKNTVSLPRWKYLPGVVEIGEKEPFRRLIHAELDVTVTLDDFTPLMSKLPEVITEIEDELKALLVERLTLAPKAGKTLPSNCLDLATSVFRCEGKACKSSFYVVGTDNIVSHNCGVDTHYSYYGYYVDHILSCSRDFRVDPVAAKTARALVLCAGLDPEKALASEMDKKDLRFACNGCVNGKPIGYSWRTALSHASAHPTLSFGVVERLNDWRVLSPTETAYLKEKEKDDPKWRADKWICSHCPDALRDGGLDRYVVVRHVQAVHKIIEPVVPTDLYFFEKVVTPFREPERLLYAPLNNPYNALNQTKKVNCLMCASGDPSARNRLFVEQGVFAHLVSRHSIKNPERGTHWAPARGG